MDTIEIEATPGSHTDGMSELERHIGDRDAQAPLRINDAIAVLTQRHGLTEDEAISTILRTIEARRASVSLSGDLLGAAATPRAS